MDIRGLRDYGQPLLNGGPEYPVLSQGNQITTAEAARKETFCKMLSFIFCPFFTAKSFIFFITIVDIAVYLVTVFWDYDPEFILVPKPQTLESFGNKNAAAIQSGEIWRLVTPLFLHVNVSHLLLNVLFQMILGFRLEPTVGAKKTFVVYFLSGISGILFSCVLAPEIYSVGASTAIMGLNASLIAWLIMNWRALANQQNRSVTIFWLILILVLNYLFGFSGSDVDNWSHLGGICGGFAVGFSIFDHIDPNSINKTVKIIAIASLLCMYFLLLVMLFAVV